MKFIVRQTIGAEVIMDVPPPQSAPAYYGGPPPETGRWHVDMNAFEEFCATHLSKADFGTSIQTFYFGFEMAELQGWGEFFAKTSEYCSYRPRMKALVSVGQIQWEEVKHLPLKGQLTALWRALLMSIERIATMKRGPKDFDSVAFADAVRVLEATCDAASFAISAA